MVTDGDAVTVTGNGADSLLPLPAGPILCVPSQRRSCYHSREQSSVAVPPKNYAEPCIRVRGVRSVRSSKASVSSASRRSLESIKRCSVRRRLTARMEFRKTIFHERLDAGSQLYQTLVNLGVTIDQFTVRTHTMAALYAVSGWADPLSFH